MTTVDRQSQHRGQQQRRDDQQHVAHPPQHDREQHVIADTAMIPACRKAELISRPASWIVTGVPVTSGATVRTAATNRSSAVVVARVALAERPRPGRGRPGRSSCPATAAAGSSSVTGLASMTRAQHVEALFEPRQQIPLATPG